MFLVCTPEYGFGWKGYQYKGGKRAKQRFTIALGLMLLVGKNLQLLF